MNGMPWASAQLEDLTGGIEVMFFPHTYSTFGAEIADDTVVLVSAKVSDDLVPEADAVLTRYRAVDATTRGAAYRSAGWSRYDENAPAYTDEEIARERDLYRSETLRN